MVNHRQYATIRIFIKIFRKEVELIVGFKAGFHKVTRNA